MSQVTVTTLPALSELHQRIVQSDFIDCYRVASSMPPRRAAEIITSFPAWARGLLVIRRLITAPFGLSNDGPQAEDKLGPFPVESESKQELVAGFNDKHLNFRVSVISHAGMVYLSTWVRPNHWSGRVYLAIIMPFHILIVRNALTRVAAAS